MIPGKAIQILRQKDRTNLSFSRLETGTEASDSALEGPETAGLPGVNPQ